jgi:hypothetical protein
MWGDPHHSCSAESRIEGAIAYSGWSCPAPRWRGLLSYGVADQGSLAGRGRILGRRAECAWRTRTERREAEAVGLLKRKGEGKGASDGVARFLYPAKAAAGPCARLARCGGRGFRMRACRLVFYFYNYLIFLLIKKFKQVNNYKLLFKIYI